MIIDNASNECICKIASLSKDGMFPIVKGLVRQGLAEYATFDRKDNLGITLHQRGKKFKALQKLESHESW